MSKVDHPAVAIVPVQSLTHRGGVRHVVPMGGDVPVALSLINIHIPDRRGRCGICEEQYPCRTHRQANQVVQTLGSFPSTPEVEQPINRVVWWGMIVCLVVAVLSLVVGIYGGGLAPLFGELA